VRFIAVGGPIRVMGFRICRSNEFISFLFMPVFSLGRVAGKQRWEISK